ncbi:HlyD family secretion protein [Mesorhizobium sp. M7A.F.Ca.US.006.04.2.1]|uniref:HlyD family secretion protein n=2 Tax=Mesorhizobium TaxID=68287 RepID=UPI000FCAAC26|nr:MULTISPECIES: HlyD family secretion protein [unclassified Mesorhizobium]RUX77206.1 HlyD family secretion protein [Mesorhizobium sp. M7A.F.Ca.US.005.03.1.1]RUY16858.1 HlyD family secretion protein [Mesorhizobium sp. M7A.F.Ca.US.005.03.2.1]RUY23219.1 HlyD family secretion protein [Mesorhizobium sp. M7A.F.Ca.US.001.04.2.1]RUY39547.1 HlyD family secretion protein [Mesorhizobium sp. M7A.F.Ca.US.001.04.1.1]RUZ99113.1 HlyD family secretion protein [Mesorhizobium sp. M7A.F.Ca.US.001.02.1.1]
MDAKTQTEEPETGDTHAAPRRATSDASPKHRKDAGQADGQEHKQDKQAREPKPSLLSFPRRHPYISIAILLAVLLIAVGLVLWWLDARQYESTDDAFIDARTVTIGAEISGRITDVAVTDNQSVKAGDVLLRIDDSDYQASLAEADAGVASAQAEIVDVGAQIEAQNAKIDAAQKQVAQAQAALEFAKAEDKRNRELLAKGTSTQQQAEQAASTLRQDQAALDSAGANVAAAKSQVTVLQAQTKSAQAKLNQAKASQEQARTMLSRTIITAPVAGRATSITAAKGTYAQPGQVLMMFVPDEVWVKANFKETQLDLMRPGQPVDIDIDAYPEKNFHGRVDSIQAGSGTAFSLLPAENATGNFVKVVQRVPVKIVFDRPPGVLLGPGLSVVPTVKVR